MKTAHIVTGGKGNIGKTAFAELLTCMAIASGHQPNLVDADYKKQTLSRWRGDAVTKLMLSDDPTFASQPDNIWRLLVNEEGNVIVDLAAQSDHLLSSWLKERGIARAAEANQIQIIKWWVADLDTDSFEELVKSYADFPTIHHVLVKSHFRARSEMWEEPLATNEALKGAIANGLKAIEFPRMFVGVMDKLRQQNVTLSTAIADEEYKHVDMLDRSTVMNWVEDAAAQVQTIYQFQPTKPAAESPGPAADNAEPTSNSPKPAASSKKKTSKAKS
ncbi:MAG: hypothetical protein WA947_08515 [Phormidesmis sp.]